MKKLRLALDELSVETFAVDTNRYDLGTVHARQEHEEEQHEDGVWSWIAGSCDHTCKISCPAPNHTLCAGGFCFTYQCKDEDVAVPIGAEPTV
jgi:hypothetical protein